MLINCLESIGYMLIIVRELIRSQYFHSHIFSHKNYRKLFFVNKNQ